MNAADFLALSITYLTVAAFYTLDVKRLATVFDYDAPLKKYALLFKLVAALLLLGSCFFWVTPEYKVEVGVTRWLSALTFCGLSVVFLAPKAPRFFLATIIVSFLIGGLLIVF